MSTILGFYMDRKLWTDPQVLALAKKVKTYADPNAKEIRTTTRRWKLDLTKGNVYKAFEPYPPGSPLNMVSRDVLRAGFANWHARGPARGSASTK